MLRKWTELVIGIILIVSPWVLGFSDISVAKWCNVLIGLVFVLISAGEIFSAKALAPIPSVEAEPKKKGNKNNVEK
jgi:SPW repeat